MTSLFFTTPDRRLALPSQQTASNTLREKIQIWLREANWEIVGPASQDGYRWVINAVRKPGPYVSFAQPDGLPDGFLIQCEMPLSEEGRTRLIQRSKEAQEQFLWDLHSLLISSGTEYSFDSPVPNAVYISETIFFGSGGLSKDRFMESMRRIGIGVSAVHISFRRLLGLLRDDNAGPSIN